MKRIYILIFLVLSLNLPLVGCAQESTQKSSAFEEKTAIEIYKEGEKYYLGANSPENHEKAFQFFERAAQQGLAIAQNDLASMYFDGQGTSQNYEKAFFWFNKAVEQNLPEAQYNLANAYFNGNGVVQDKKKALELYIKAAEQDFPEAQYNLAYLYQHDLHDKSKAIYWYKKAKENGIELANDALNEID